MLEQLHPAPTVNTGHQHSRLFFFFLILSCVCFSRWTSSLLKKKKPQKNSGNRATSLLNNDYLSKETDKINSATQWIIHCDESNYNRVVFKNIPLFVTSMKRVLTSLDDGGVERVEEEVVTQSGGWSNAAAAWCLVLGPLRDSLGQRQKQWRSEEPRAQASRMSSHIQRLSHQEIKTKKE